MLYRIFTAQMFVYDEQSLHIKFSNLKKKTYNNVCVMAPRRLETISLHPTLLFPIHPHVHSPTP
jgi:hypothetical protein